jgi:hypothetical protein
MNNPPFPAGPRRSGNPPVPPSADWQAAVGVILERLESIRSEVGHGRAAKSHFTVAEVSESVGRSEYRVRAWLKAGRLKGVKVGGVGPRSRWLVPREELERLFASGLHAD